jgi:hypothetical protein
VGSAAAQDVATTEPPVRTTEASPSPLPSSSPSPSPSPSPTPTPVPAPPPEPQLTVGQQNALRAGADYLGFSAFSRSGLIAQLEYEGYSTDDASWAVDRLNVDWNEQAAEAAQDYLAFSSFSRSGLIAQLEYEGYTHEQAEYGVTQAGY